MRLFCTVFDFDPPHLHLAPPKGMIPVEFRGDLWQQKTRVPGLSYGVVCVILRLAVLVEHLLLTDGWTDTGSWLVPRMRGIARGKNSVKTENRAAGLRLQLCVVM